MMTKPSALAGRGGREHQLQPNNTAFNPFLTQYTATPATGQQLPPPKHLQHQIPKEASPALSKASQSFSTSPGQSTVRGGLYRGRGRVSRGIGRGRGRGSDTTNSHNNLLQQGQTLRVLGWSRAGVARGGNSARGAAAAKNLSSNHTAGSEHTEGAATLGVRSSETGEPLNWGVVQLSQQYSTFPSKKSPNPPSASFQSSQPHTIPVHWTNYENCANFLKQNIDNQLNIPTQIVMEGQQSGARGGSRGRGRGAASSREGSEGANGRGRGRGRVSEAGSTRGTRGSRGGARGGRGGGGGGDNSYAAGGYESDSATAAGSLFISGANDEFESEMESERELNNGATKGERAVRFSEGTSGHNKMAKLKAAREKERADLIRRGIIDDPDNRKPLSEALVFVGTCMEMCPMFEREERQFQKNVDKMEIDPQTGMIDPKRAVKAFHRPAAGNESALPSDVRPPPVLVKTLDYLIREIVGGSQPLMSTHGFVRDRTRGIRQDFTLQNYRGLETIECHERIARYHILCIHLLAQDDRFVLQQEMEQLQKTMTTLNELYDDAKMDGMFCPNEPEFRTYQILIYLHDMEFERAAQRWPFTDTDIGVQQALRLHQAAFRNAPRFFGLLRREQTTYLMGCIAEAHFYHVRKEHFRKMRQSYNKDTTSVTLSDITRQLGFDHQNDLDRYCEHFGIETAVDNQGVEYIIPNRNFDDSRPQLRPTCNQRIVEAKRKGRIIPDIINSVHGPQARIKAGPFEEDPSGYIDTAPQKIQSWVPDNDDGEASPGQPQQWGNSHAFEQQKPTFSQPLQPSNAKQPAFTGANGFQQQTAFGDQQKQQSGFSSQQPNVFQRTVSPFGGAQKQQAPSPQPQSAFQQAMQKFPNPSAPAFQPSQPAPAFQTQQRPPAFQPAQPPPAFQAPAFTQTPNAFSQASTAFSAPAFTAASPFGTNMANAFGGAFGKPSVSPVPFEPTPDPRLKNNASPSNPSSVFAKPAGQPAGGINGGSGFQQPPASSQGQDYYWQEGEQYQDREGGGEEEYGEEYQADETAGGEEEDDEFAAKQAELLRKQEEVAQRQRELDFKLEEAKRKIAEKEDMRRKKERESELRHQLLKHRAETNQYAQQQQSVFSQQPAQAPQQQQQSVFAQQPAQPTQSVFDFSVPQPVPQQQPSVGNIFGPPTTQAASQDAFKMPQPSPGFSNSIASNLEQAANNHPTPYSPSQSVFQPTSSAFAAEKQPESQPQPNVEQGLVPPPEPVEDPAVVMNRFGIYVKARMRDVIQSPNPTARKSILTELQGDLSDGLESQPGMDSCRDILADAYSHANLTNTLLTIWRKHTAAKVRKAKITALRAEKRRILAEKEKGLGTQEGQWVPVKIKLRQGQDLVEQGLLFRDLNFGPVPIVDMFAPSLQRAFESRQVKNTNFTLLVLNAEPKAEYWWLRKFGISSGSGLGVNAAEKKLKNGNRFTVDRVLVEPKPPGDVGALVYGCRADYSLSNEERFARDKQDLHLAMDYALRESRYEKLAVMVVCYRSPLDTTDADPYGGDTERTSTEGRRARLKAIRKALDFSAKSHGLERIIAKEVVLIETLEDTNLLRPMAKLAKFIAGAVGGKKKEEEEGKGKELEAYEDVISVPIPSGETQKEEEVGVLVGPGALQVHGKPKQRVPKRRISSTSLVSSPVDNKKFGGSVSRSNSSPATTAARALRNSINGSVGGRPTPTSTAETPLNDSTTITQLVKSAKSSPSISINSNLILNNLNSSSSSLRAFNNVKQTGMTSDYFLLKASGIDLAHSYSQTLGKQNGLQHNHNNHLRKSSYSDEEDITTTTNGASSSRNRLRRKLPLITREHDEVGKSVFSQALSNSIGLTGASSSATTIISATIAGGGRRKRSRSATEEEDGDAGGEGVGAGARRFGSSPEQNQGAGLVKYYDYDGDRRKKSSTGGGGGGGYDFDDDPVVREARRIREAPEYHPELQFPELLMDEHGDGRAGGDGDGYAHHWPK